MPQPGVADEHWKSAQTKRISRGGRGAGAWCRTCCYWFCGSDGEWNVLDGSIGGGGFWAIIERKIGADFVLIVRASSRASPLPQLPGMDANPVFTKEPCGWLARDDGLSGATKLSPWRQPQACSPALPTHRTLRRSDTRAATPPRARSVLRCRPSWRSPPICHSQCAG